MKEVNLFTYLNSILKKEESLETYLKFFKEQDEWKNFNGYMLIRYIYYAGFINIANVYNWFLNTLNKEQLFVLMYKMTPKYNGFVKYIKKIKTEDLKVMEYLKNYYQCSEERAREYLKFLNNDDVNEILDKYAIDEKNKKKMIKEL
jgi:hypothetical protein